MVRSEMRRELVTGFSGSLPRLAAITAVAFALGLAGCGRKGPLDPPPSVAVPAATERQAQPAGGGPTDQARPRRTHFFLDWLID
jgi:predicted small lipoprotein YifL